MALSKSQITTKLAKNGIRCYPLDNTSFYIPTKDPKATLQLALGLFMADGAKYEPKSRYSTQGCVRIGNFTIVTTPASYVPKQPRNVPSGNESVTNRLMLSLMITDVLNTVAKPLTIIFDGGKKVTVKNVTGLKFSGKGVSDFTLHQGTKQIPMAVNIPNGSYRHMLSGRYLDLAYDALENATTNEIIDADMKGDVMTLNAAIAFPADSRSVRELIFQDINGGFGVVGNFIPSDFKYDGRSHTLTIKCARAYVTSVDLKSRDKPYFAIVNSRTGSIGELKGLQLDLVPQSGLPKRMTLVDI